MVIPENSSGPKARAVTKAQRSAAIKAGIARAKRHGRVGFPKLVSDDAIQAVRHLPTAEAAEKVGLSKSHYIVRRREIERREEVTAS